MKIIQLLKRMLQTNDFVRSVAILVSGSAISQAVVVLLTPLLTRLYTPEDFGVLSVYLSIVLTIAIIASWQYEHAIPLPKEEKYAINLLVLSLLILLLNTILIAVLLKVLKEPIMSIFDTNGLQTILIFLPLSLFGFGLFQLFEKWMLRQENYPKITTGKVRMNLSQVFSQAGFGLILPSSGSLMAGEVLGRLTGGGGMAYVSLKSMKGMFSSVSVKSLIWVAQRYLRFPLISSSSSLLSGITQHLPALFIAFALGAKEAGWYLLANRILAFPDALLGYSVKQVYIAKSAKLIHISFDKFISLFWHTVKKMGIISVLVYTMIALIAPQFFPIIFGSAWQEAGVFLQFLSIFFLFQLVVGPISATFILLEELYMQVLTEFVRFVLLLGSMGVAYVYLDQSWQVVLCISLGQALGSLIEGVLSWAAIHHKQRKRHKTIRIKQRDMEIGTSGQQLEKVMEKQAKDIEV